MGLFHAIKGNLEQASKANNKKYIFYRVGEWMSNYENRFIAFIDILGFKNIIDKTLMDQETYKTVLSAVNYISGVRKENYEGFLSEYGILKEVSVFSDSIVISYAYDITGGLFHILMDLVFISFNLTASGIFIRGGVTYGELYHKESVCFGPAMIKAYKLESEEAIYPRIVVDEVAIKYGIIYHGSANTHEHEAEYLESLLAKGKDAKYYLDFLSQSQEFDQSYDYFVVIKKIRNETIKNLKEYNNIRKIFKKYKWFAKYYNLTIKKLYKRKFICKNDLLILDKFMKMSL